MISVLKGRGYGRVVDMSVEEANKKYFEGTGGHSCLQNKRVHSLRTFACRPRLCWDTLASGARVAQD